MATVAEELLTAEEFAGMPDPGYPTELVRGRVVRVPSPGFEHGQVCNRIGRFLGNHADEHNLGHVLNNDSGVITEQGPDSVRGADVAFYSFGKVPKGTSIKGYPDVPPELIFEVLSPSDRLNKLLVKVGEYLEAGVTLVSVVDPRTTLVHLFRANETRTLGPDDEWSAPEVLGEFRVPVRRFFE